MTTTTLHTENFDAEDSFERIHDAIRLWVQHGARIEDVTYHRDPMVMADPSTKARITLTMTKSGAVGSDEVRRSYNSSTTVQTVAQVGVRLVRVQCKVESYSAKLSAHTIMERIRQRAQLARLNYSTELRAENISINEVGDSVNLPTSYDHMVISAVSADMVFNVASIVLDAPETWVQNVNATGNPTT